MNLKWIFRTIIILCAFVAGAWGIGLTSTLPPEFDTFYDDVVRQANTKIDQKIKTYQIKIKSGKLKPYEKEKYESYIKILKKSKKRLSDEETFRKLYDSLKQGGQSIVDILKNWERNNLRELGAVNPEELVVLDLKWLNEKAVSAYDYYKKIVDLQNKLKSIESVHYLPETQRMLKSLTVLSTLMSEFGESKIPIIGSIIKAYGDITLEFINVISTLNSRIKKNIEQGNVGTGTYTGSGLKGQAWVRQKIGYELEPVPGFKGIYRATENPSLFYLWDEKYRGKSGEMGRWIPAKGLDYFELKRRYLRLFKTKGVKHFSIEYLARKYGKILEASVTTKPEVMLPGEPYKLCVKLYRIKDHKEATKAELSVEVKSVRKQLREGECVELKAPDKPGTYPVTLKLSKESGAVWVLDRVKNGEVKVGRKNKIKLSVRPRQLDCLETTEVEIMARVFNSDNREVDKGIVTFSVISPRGRKGYYGNFEPSDFFVLGKDMQPIRIKWSCGYLDKDGTYTIVATYEPYKNIKNPESRSEDRKTIKIRFPRVENYIGLKLGEAISKIREIKGKRIRIEVTPSNARKNGIVKWQYPRQGMPIQNIGTIQLDVKNPPVRSMPNLICKSKDYIFQHYPNYHIKFYKTDKNNANCSEGEATAQLPRSGTNLDDYNGDITVWIYIKNDQGSNSNPPDSIIDKECLPTCHKYGYKYAFYGLKYPWECFCADDPSGSHGYIVKKDNDNAESDLKGRKDSNTSLNNQDENESQEMVTSTYENNIDRLGLDYNSFDLPRADPHLCQKACLRDTRCKAWTYVKPNTTQGPHPRCWLKYAVPKPLRRSCCISGFKKSSKKNPEINHEKIRKTRLYRKPKIGAYRLDWCREWNRDCGGEAADLFCKQKGYDKAQSWAKDRHIGDRMATKVISTGQICNQNFCDGFKYIRCIKRLNH